MHKVKKMGTIIGIVFMIPHIQGSFGSLAERYQQGLLNFSNFLPSDTVRTVGQSIFKGVAHVRTSNALCAEEKTFVAARKNKVKKKLEELGASSVRKVPTIAFVASGGGYRAMLATIGCINGLHKIGLLDTITYTVGLSGSTWGLSYWITEGKSIDETAHSIITRVTNRNFGVLTRSEGQFLITRLGIKRGFGQPIGAVDLYGGILANTLFSNFGDKRQDLLLSGQGEQIKNGAYPMPLYTAIRTDTTSSQWYEFSPYEVGASWLSAYVPTWGFGRKFSQGASVDLAPEQSLGYFLGLFGSAFSASVGEISARVIQQIAPQTPQALIDQLMKSAQNVRFFVPKAYNFTAGMSGSPLTQDEFIMLGDAGAAPGFELPYPPISGERPERKADIIIFMDASVPRTQTFPLVKVAQYAQMRNLKFPSVTNPENLGKNTLTILKDDTDSTVPLVLYMPLYNDKTLVDTYKNNPQFSPYATLASFDVDECTRTGSCQTQSFAYTERAAEDLIKMYEFNVVVNGEKLKQAIVTATAKMQ
jgi:phospholipase A2